MIKPKRKSLQPYNRAHPYDDRRGSSNDHVVLPDIYGNVNSSQIGRPYPFTNNAAEQSNVMITKLLNRKKSYERMMRVEEGGNGS